MRGKVCYIDRKVNQEGQDTRKTHWLVEVYTIQRYCSIYQLKRTSFLFILLQIYKRHLMKCHLVASILQCVKQLRKKNKKRKKKEITERIQSHIILPCSCFAHSRRIFRRFKTRAKRDEQIFHTFNSEQQLRSRKKRERKN